MARRSTRARAHNKPAQPPVAAPSPIEAPSAPAEAAAAPDAPEIGADAEIPAVGDPQAAGDADLGAEAASADEGAETDIEDGQEADAAAAPASEKIVDGLIGGDTPVPMSHPDGGSCDLYKADKAGNLLVPAADVPAMQAHGFIVAGAE